MVMEKEEYNKRSKSKYYKYIDSHVDKMIGNILRSVEIAVPDDKPFQKLRKQILKFCNDLGRDLKNELENNYDVSYRVTKEEIIEVHPPKRVV